MSKFLANIGAALRTPGLGERLQAALAAAGGDTNALMRLRALQLQRAELQRQNDARDAQVIGAKNLGFSNDEIGPMGAQDLSLAARQRMAIGDGQASAIDEGNGAELDRTAGIQHAAAAIQRGADPDAVRARLQVMGHADFDPPSPFSDIKPDGRQVSQADPLRIRTGFKASGPPHVSKQRLEIQQDRRIADQLARERGGDASDAEALYRGMRGLPVHPPSAAGAPAQTVGSLPSRATPLGLRGAAEAASPRIPPPAPWRQGGSMPPAEVDRYAELGMRMYQLHRARGMSPQQAAAWAANAAAESHGNYNEPQNGGGPGWGIFQWGSNNPAMDRRRTFEQVFGHPIQQSTEEEQLAFRDWELAHAYAGAARRIARTTSAGDAAAVITRYYEGPQDRVHPVIDRANIAEAILRRAMRRPGTANPNVTPGGVR